MTSSLSFGPWLVRPVDWPSSNCNCHNSNLQR